MDRPAWCVRRGFGGGGFAGGTDAAGNQPDGTHIVVVRPAGVYLVDVASGEETEVLPEVDYFRSSGVDGLAVGPGGKAVAVSDDRGVRLIRWPAGEREEVLVADLPARWMEVSADGNWLVVLTARGLDLVDLASDASQRIARPRDVEGFQFWRPGELAVFGPGSFAIWALAPGEEARPQETVRAEGIKCLFEAGGGRVVGFAGGYRSRETGVVVWATGGEGWERAGEHSFGYGLARWWVFAHSCADSRRIAVDASAGRLAMRGAPATVVDLETGKEWSLAGADGKMGILLVPRKNQVVTAGLDGTLALFSLDGPGPTLLRQAQLPTGADRAWMGAASALAVMLLGFWGGFGPARGKLAGRERVAKGALWALASALTGIMAIQFFPRTPLELPGDGVGLLVGALLVLFPLYLAWRMRVSLVGALAHSLVAALLAVAAIGYDFTLAGYQAIHPTWAGFGHNPLMTGTGVVFAALFVAVARAVWVVAGRIPSVGLTGLVRALAWLAGVGLAGLAVLLPFIGPGTMVSWSWVVVWPAAVVIALRWWSHLVRQTEA